MKPQLRFNGFHDEWEEKKLGDILSMLKSGLSRQLSFDNIGIPVLRANNVNGSFVDLSDLKYWYLEDPQGAKIENYIVDKGDLLINFINSIPKMGTASIYDKNEKVIYTTNLLRAKTKDNFSTLFLLYYTQTNRYKYDIFSITKPAVNQASFTTKDFKKILIQVPSLSEQEKIGQFLSLIDQRIEKQEKKIELLKEQKRGWMQKIFNQEIRFKDENGNDYPDWEEHRVFDFGKIVTGNTPSKAVPEFYSNSSGYVWVTPADISDNQYISSSNLFLTDQGFEKARKLPKNTLLVTCIASIGKNAILKCEGSCNQQINAIIPNNNYDIDFLYFLMEYYKRFLESKAGQTATKIINKTDFSNLLFLVPSLPEQQKIADFLSTQNQLIEKEEQKLALMREEKKGLLQQMFLPNTSNEKSDFVEGNFEIILKNGKSFNVKGSLENSGKDLILNLDDTDLLQEVASKKAESHNGSTYFDSESYSSMNRKIQHIYGTLSDGKRVIINSFYIKDTITAIYKKIEIRIKIHIIDATFYEGVEEDFNKLCQKLSSMKRINLCYDFLKQTVIKSINWDETQSLIRVEEDNGDICLLYSNKTAITLGEVRNLHVKISVIYQLLTDEELSLKKLFYKLAGDAFYFYNADLCDSNQGEQDNVMTVPVYFSSLLKSLLNLKENDKLGELANDYIMQLRYIKLVENKLTTFMSLIERYYPDEKPKNSQRKKWYAFDKLEEMFESLPQCVQDKIIEGFKDNDLIKLQPKPKSQFKPKTTKEKLLRIIINNRVYRTHGTEGKDFIVKDIRLNILIVEWLSLIIRSFILYKLDLGEEALLEIVEKRIGYINSIYIIGEF